MLPRTPSRAGCPISSGVGGAAHGSPFISSGVGGVSQPLAANRHPLLAVPLARLAVHGASGARTGLLDRSSSFRRVPASLEVHFIGVESVLLKLGLGLIGE